jgi:hypothetical protein
MSHKLLLASATLLTALSAQATVSVTSASFAYSQSFDSLATSGATNVWANDSTLAGWSLFNGAIALTNYRGGTGSDNAGAVYSFGVSASGERALGSVASGTVAAPTLVAAFTNNSGTALTSFTLGYDGEQWRNGGNASLAAHKLTVQYGFGASFAAVTDWTTAGAGFDFTSPVTAATGGAVVGNTAGLMSGLGGTVTTDWAAGSTLWVRWNDANDIGNDHGLAIDNVTLSVTAVPEPGTYAMLLAGLGAIGFIARRHRG